MAKKNVKKAKLCRIFLTLSAPHITIKRSNAITEILMRLKLKNIATVSSGVTFRSSIEYSREGDVCVIRMKDLGDDNLVHLDGLTRLDHPTIKANQLVQPGDIIFALAVVQPWLLC